MRMSDAFATWVRYAHRRADGPPVPFSGIILLHCIRLAGQAQTASELRLFTSPYALHHIQEGLRALQKAGLVIAERDRTSREARYSLTPLGLKVTTAYALLRERGLIELRAKEKSMTALVDSAAVTLDRLCGLYRQAVQRLSDDAVLEPSIRLAGANAPRRSKSRPKRRKT